ncbi:Uncharacterised protein [Candidatus Gugararchaeum adminiculabundum]|nr:Uncharacterised protein [Candidatus Gugararchaeum adminiculabundum]
MSNSELITSSPGAGGLARGVVSSALKIDTASALWIISNAKILIELLEARQALVNGGAVDARAIPRLTKEQRLALVGKFSGQVPNFKQMSIAEKVNALRSIRNKAIWEVFLQNTLSMSDEVKQVHLHQSEKGDSVVVHLNGYIPIRNFHLASEVGIIVMIDAKKGEQSIVLPRNFAAGPDSSNLSNLQDAVWSLLDSCTAAAKPQASVQLEFLPRLPSPEPLALVRSQVNAVILAPKPAAPAGEQEAQVLPSSAQQKLEMIDTFESMVTEYGTGKRTLNSISQFNFYAGEDENGKPRGDCLGQEIWFRYTGPGLKNSPPQERKFAIVKGKGNKCYTAQDKRKVSINQGELFDFIVENNLTELSAPELSKKLNALRAEIFGLPQAVKTHKVDLLQPKTTALDFAIQSPATGAPEFQIPHQVATVPVELLPTQAQATSKKPIRIPMELTRVRSTAQQLSDLLSTKDPASFQDQSDVPLSVQLAWYVEYLNQKFPSPGPSAFETNPELQRLRATTQMQLALLLSKTDPAVFRPRSITPLNPIPFIEPETTIEIRRLADYSLAYRLIPGNEKSRHFPAALAAGIFTAAFIGTFFAYHLSSTGPAKHRDSPVPKPAAAATPLAGYPALTIPKTRPQTSKPILRHLGARAGIRAARRLRRYSSAEYPAVKLSPINPNPLTAKFAPGVLANLSNRRNAQPEFPPILAPDPSPTATATVSEPAATAPAPVLLRIPPKEITPAQPEPPKTAEAAGIQMPDQFERRHLDTSEVTGPGQPSVVAPEKQTKRSIFSLGGFRKQR